MMNQKPDLEPTVYELLIVVGPDGEAWELHNTPATITVGELEAMARAYFGYRELDSHAIGFRTNDGLLLQLPDQSLREAGVQPQDRLQMVPAVTAGGPEWIDVEKFIAEAVASGITGNTAFFLLNKTVRSVRTRLQKLREAKHSHTEHKPLGLEEETLKAAQPEILSLKQDEAVDIAVTCICLRFDINPGDLKVVVSTNHSSSPSRKGEWTVMLRSDAAEIFGSAYVRAKVCSADPEHPQIIIVPSWVDLSE